MRENPVRNANTIKKICKNLYLYGKIAAIPAKKTKTQDVCPLGNELYAFQSSTPSTVGGKSMPKLLKSVYGRGCAIVYLKICVIKEQIP